MKNSNLRAVKLAQCLVIDSKHNSFSVDTFSLVDLLLKLKNILMLTFDFDDCLIELQRRNNL